MDLGFKQKKQNFIFILLDRLAHLMLIIFRICPTYKENCNQNTRLILLCFCVGIQESWKHLSLVTSFLCLYTACDINTMQHNSEVS